MGYVLLTEFQKGGNDELLQSARMHTRGKGQRPLRLPFGSDAPERVTIGFERWFRSDAPERPVEGIKIFVQSDGPTLSRP